MEVAQQKLEFVFGVGVGTQVNADAVFEPDRNRGFETPLPENRDEFGLCQIVGKFGGHDRCLPAHASQAAVCLLLVLRRTDQ